MFESAAYELHPFGVEVAIVQPGAYTTQFKANSTRYFNEMMMRLATEDRLRAQAYEEHITVTKAGLQEEETPPAQQVADAVLELAQTPQGQRPLRRVVMPPQFAEGLNQLNSTLEGVQEGLLKGSGMGAWLNIEGQE
jgi:NAD(P)-dependent dehydrogenase (short-subunit alcohol dehydrogenase family)